MSNHICGIHGNLIKVNKICIKGSFCDVQMKQNKCAWKSQQD